MKHWEEPIDSEEIKAETLIACIDDSLNFYVQNLGIFFRNYSEDIFSIEKDKDSDNVINLSRDGVFHILPEGLFFNEDFLKSKNKPGYDFKEVFKKFKDEKEKINSFFRPIDTEFFKLSFELEKKLNEISEKGNEFIIESLLIGCNLATGNEYIRKMKILLPFVSEIRGNLRLLKDFLQIIFLSKVEIIKKDFSIMFIIHKRGLSKEEYLKMDNDLIAFFDFVYEWFLPVEIEYGYKIKDYEEPFVLGHSLILDYNTYLK